eukprot:gnl/TRDRNA2_/TRDRNA2_178400_c0_seq1.p1 gnl/TRDRNA2_/TRDRNA2_178400_c0~~gnl/TRDRNA2_/TRDRNA2_178400_c0_seq1.p1  ORF type:complete len:328 (+),score=41.06 gnl/TRDRNA2_/TRDRNA2_178400_c0_seq1:145-984(+)
MVGDARLEALTAMVDGPEVEDSAHTPSTHVRRSRRRRRHGAHKVSAALGPPPGVFLVDSDDEDGNGAGAQEPMLLGSFGHSTKERNVVTWNDLCDGTPTKKVGALDRPASAPSPHSMASPSHSMAAVSQSPFSTASAVWPSEGEKGYEKVPRDPMVQWPSSWSQGPGMHCLLVLPPPVQALPVPEMHQPVMPMQAPQPVLPLAQPQHPYTAEQPNEWALCDCTLAEQATGLAAPPAPEWSNSHSDAMRQILFGNTGGQMPSQAELLEQLQAVSQQAYED